MSTQLPLEKAIHELVDEFTREPYIFFTEADAVARFHQLLTDNPIFNRRVRTSDDDGHEISLVHREYPTFFRFDDSDPTERLEPLARRGHYDTVILNPEFVAAHPVETVLNRNIKAVRDLSVMPFDAVIEFKLHTRGWSKGRSEGIVKELGKLHLSAKEAPLRYLVVLQRYLEPRLYRWEKYWPNVVKAVNAQEDIGSRGQRLRTGHIHHAHHGPGQHFDNLLNHTPVKQDASQTRKEDDQRQHRERKIVISELISE